MLKRRKLIIVGDSAFAQIAYEYFTYDSDYEVAGFSVESRYLKQEELFGLPVHPFESLEERFAPAGHDVHVAVVYTQLNRLRARLAAASKAKGYNLASYVSSKAFVWRNVEVGEHCFIFENNVVQPFVRLGRNLVLWSGNHIGHHSTIGDHCFLSSHVVISGFVEVGKSCFLGVNSTVINNLKIADDCWIGPAVVLTRDAKQGSLYKPGKTEAAPLSTYAYFKVEE